MTARATFIEKLLSVFFVSIFVLYVIPRWTPGNFPATALLFASIAIISFALGRFLAGDSDRLMFVIIALVIVADALLFVIAPSVF